MSAENVIVVENWAEARRLGARSVAGVFRSGDGSRFVSVAAGSRAVEGLRVAEVEWTPRAASHPRADELRTALVHSQSKSGRA